MDDHTPVSSSPQQIALISTCVVAMFLIDSEREAKKNVKGK